MESSLPHEPHENTLKRWVCERYESGMGVIDIAKELKLPVLKVANLVKRYLDVPSPRRPQRSEEKGRKHMRGCRPTL